MAKSWNKKGQNRQKWHFWAKVEISLIIKKDE